MRNLLGVEANGVRTKKVGSLGTRVFVKVIRPNSKVIIIDRAGERPVAVVFPRTRSAIVVCDDDQRQLVWRHIGQIFPAEVPNALEIAPCCMGMKIPDHREMRKIVEEFMDAFGCTVVFLNAAMKSLRRLVRNRVLNYITVAAVAIPKKDAIALLLVDFDRRNEQSPKGVGGDVNVHRGIVAIRCGHMKWFLFHKKKGPQCAAPSYLGLRA